MVEAFNKDGILEEKNMPGLLRNRKISILDNNVHVPGILLGVSKNKMKHVLYPRDCPVLVNVYIIILFFCMSPFLNTFVIPSFYQNIVPAVAPLPHNLAFFFCRYSSSTYKLKNKSIPLKTMNISLLIMIFVG